MKRHGRNALGILALTIALSLLLCGCAGGSGAGEEALPDAPKQEALEITYIGNEGFLIAAGEIKVLVDALYRDGVSGYLVHPPELRQQMESARPPFDGVDLVLATHFHTDHFDAGAVTAHLEANPAALFISTDQALERMRGEAGWEAVSGRTRARFPAEGERITVTHGGASVTIINLHHGRGGSTQNLGFLIEIGGKSLLHMGDTQTDGKDLAVHKLGDREVDIGLLPYWLLLDPALGRAVQGRIGAKRLIPIHIPHEKAPEGFFSTHGSLEEMLTAIQEDWPSAVIFRRPMETRTF